MKKISLIKALRCLNLEKAFIRYKPNLFHLKSFGCIVCCYISSIYRHKLKSKTIFTLFIGYDKFNKAYYC